MFFILSSAAVVSDLKNMQPKYTDSHILQPCHRGRQCLCVSQVGKHLLSVIISGFRGLARDDNVGPYMVSPLLAKERSWSSRPVVTSLFICVYPTADMLREIWQCPLVTTQVNTNPVTRFGSRLPSSGGPLCFAARLLGGLPSSPAVPGQRYHYTPQQTSQLWSAPGSEGWMTRLVLCPNVLKCTLGEWVCSYVGWMWIEILFPRVSGVHILPGRTPARHMSSFKLASIFSGNPPKFWQL